jgi:prepilin-type N-terminal cleavage/methylation domain-containing protein
MSKPETLASSPRKGFSLVEVLVVMGIIAFLTAAIVVVLPRVANASKVAATRATIKKVDELLNDRINGFRRYIQTQDQQAGTGIPSYVDLGLVQQLGGLPALPAAKLVGMKQLFRAKFPQSYAELNPPPSPSAGHKTSTESAACLYIILTQMAIFDTEPPSATDLRGLEVADTDGDGLLEIVDAWGQPLRFYRWPTRLIRPNPETASVTGFVESNPSPLTLFMGAAAARAPLAVWGSGKTYSLGANVLPGPPPQTSPFSFIYKCAAATSPYQSGSTQPTWPVVAGATVADQNLTWQAVQDPLSVDPDDPQGIIPTGVVSETPTASSVIIETPNTWNMTLIVSCGPDGLLGLFESPDLSDFGNLAQPQPDPSDPTGFLRSAMYDNLTNHEQ